MLVMTDIETGISDTTTKLYNCNNPSILSDGSNQFGISCMPSVGGITPGSLDLNIDNIAAPDIKAY
jgi:hypothetical protein